MHRIDLSKLSPELRIHVTPMSELTLEEQVKKVNYQRTGEQMVIDSEELYERLAQSGADKNKMTVWSKSELAHVGRRALNTGTYCPRVGVYKVVEECKLENSIMLKAHFKANILDEFDDQLFEIKKSPLFNKNSSKPLVYEEYSSKDIKLNSPDLIGKTIHVKDVKLKEDGNFNGKKYSYYYIEWDLID